MLILQIPAAWMLADAMSGPLHWLLDKKIKTDGFFPGLAEDNERHHRDPSSILQISIWSNMSTSLPALPISVALFFAGAPTFLWLAFAFLLFVNVIHRWAHTSPERLPLPVVWLQRIGIFQSQDHHAQHHYVAGKLCTPAGSRSGYCSMSNFLNPIVDRIFLSM